MTNLYDISYGQKYDANLSIKEIAQILRKELKSLKGFKFSVRSNTTRIDVRLKDAPTDFQFFETVETAWLTDYATTDAYQSLTKKVKDLGHAYNFDGSDVMTDYYHVNYFFNFDIAYGTEVYKLYSQQLTLQRRLIESQH